MATLYIQEYERLVNNPVGNQVIQAGQEPAVTNQTVTFTATAGASAAFNSSTNFIRVYSDTAGYIKFGAAPTAVTATDMPISANTPEFFGVVPGQKISVVT